jgi:rhodanese-related sulfurtransferase
MSELFKRFPVIHDSKLKELIETEPDSLFIVDLRSADHYSAGHIPGAYSIPFNTFDEKIKSVPRDKTVVVYCEAGIKSPLIVEKLKNLNYTHVYSLGGLQRWSYDLVCD